MCIRDRLSTIAPDKHTLAATALDLLAERIQGYDGPPRTIDTPYSLVVRESTAPGAVEASPPIPAPSAAAGAAPSAAPPPPGAVLPGPDPTARPENEELPR